jgi:hypothetical protein
MIAQTIECDTYISSKNGKLPITGSRELIIE